jgi:pyrroloquinoline quinone (PQQ) biosynthesis protein C
MSPPSDFVRQLQREVAEHPAVCHPFLAKVASRPMSRRAWLAFGQHLHPHVHFFIPYMEFLLLNTFDMNAKVLMAKILLDEYGEFSGSVSHPELFRRFIVAAGGEGADRSLFETPLDPATVEMVETHVRLCRDDPFLVGLGAIGPAHELAITRMFPALVDGLRISGFSEEERRFFSLHVEHDEEHAGLLEIAITDLAQTEAHQAQVRYGLQVSLRARDALWSAMDRRMTAVDDGRPPPPGGPTLRELTRPFDTVPDTFWPLLAAKTRS